MSNDTPISLATGLPVEDKIPTIVPNTPAPISDQAIDRRGNMAAYGLAGRTNKNAEDIKEGIRTGSEDSLRVDVAGQIDGLASQNTQQQMAQMARTGTLRPDNIPSFTPSDPKSIFEDTYSNAWFRNVYSTINPDSESENGMTSEAVNILPGQIQQTEEVATEALSKYQYALKKIEDAEAKVEAQGYLGWTADFAKGFFPGYTEAKVRGNVKGTGFFEGGLRGENLEIQRTQLLSLPYAEYKKQFDEIMDRLEKDNPQLAVDFAHSMAGKSVDDQTMDSIFTLIDMTMYPAVFKIGGSAAKSAILYNHARVTARQMVQGALNVSKQPIKVAAADAAGDLGEAAVQKELGNKVSELKGLRDPTVEAREALPAVLNLDQKLATDSPGRFGQEIVNRLNESYNNFKTNLMTIVENITKVERIPYVLAYEKGIRAVKDEIRRLYPGISNDILNISDPIWEPISNTHYVRVNIGNKGAEYFTRADIAQHYAELHNLSIGRTKITLPGFKTEGRSTYKMHEDGTTTRYQGTVKGDIAVGDNVHPLAKDGSRVLKDAVKVDEIVSKDGTKFAKFTNPDTKAPAYWEVSQLEHETPKTTVGVGEKSPRSHKTIYMSAEDVNKLKVDPNAPVQAGNITVKGPRVYHALLHGDNTVSFYHRLPDPRFRQYPPNMRRPFSTQPAPGMVAVELSDAAKPSSSLPYNTAFSKFRFSHTITELTPGTKIPPSNAFTIEHSGNGYHIQTIKPINETWDAVRDAIRDGVNVDGKEATPNSWVNAFIGWIRTPEDTLSFQQRVNRKVATYAPSVLMSLMQSEAKAIKELAKRTIPGTNRRARWDDFERILEHGRTLDNPDTGKKGYFFKSPQELEQKYDELLHRFPDQVEIQAYFAFKRIVEADRVLRNILLYRNASRLGVENHVIYQLGEDGKRLASPAFDGVRLKFLPGGKDDTIAIFSGQHGMEDLREVSTIGSGKLRKELEERIKNGSKVVIELHDPEQRPLNGFGRISHTDRIRYAVIDADKLETSPLKWDRLARQEGGHFDYDYDFYIKQARMRFDRSTLKHWYEGDTTIMPVMNRAMGQKFVSALEEVRIALAAKDLVKAKEAAKKLPLEWKEVSSWFRPQKDPNGVLQPARLDVKEPITVVSKDSMIIDKDKALESRYRKTRKDGSVEDRFVDGTKHGSLARMNQVQYARERDAYEMLSPRDIGTKNNPLFQVEAAKMIDPIPTMNRAMTKITQSMFMDDYKLYSMEHWLREAAPFMRAGESDIRKSPYFHFNNPEFKEGAMKEHPEIVSNLKSNWYKIRQFTGMRNVVDTFLAASAQRLADAVYTDLGPKAMEIAPTWALTKLRDPYRFVRSVVFNLKMGLYAVPQFMVHAMTYANVAGISGPIRASQGMAAATLHLYGHFAGNEQVLQHLDSVASRMGWKPGEWLEARQAALNTGFFNEAGEYALKDDLMSNKVMKSGADRFLESGQMFFRNGVRTLRAGSWYTAYREFREGHEFFKGGARATGRLTNEDIGMITERADLLAHNMTRASTSQFQTGILSIPTQFYSYFLRLSEMMLGNRLSGIEKARLIGVNAALFGIPVTSGLTGAPFFESLRKNAIDNGYVIGDNFIDTLAMEGIPATIIGLISGGGDLHKGWIPNFGERYGPKGIDPLGEAFMEDKTMWDILGGASYSTIKNMFERTNGYWFLMSSYMKGEDPYPFTADMIMDLFKEVSSVNYAWKSWYAINTGKMLTKKNAVVSSDATPMQAIIGGLTGLQQQAAVDTWTGAQLIKDRKEKEHAGLNYFLERFKLGLEATKDDNADQAFKYYSQAFKLLDIHDYPEEKRSAAIALASKEYKGLIREINWDLAFRDVPESKKPVMLERIKKLMQMEQERQ